MIRDNNLLLDFLEHSIGNVFKILPLYEEENEGLDSYIDSLLMELYKLVNTFEVEDSYKYTSLILTLESVKELSLKDNNQAIIKREVFKSISIIKSIISNIEGV